jgi:pimeloyl-ACP methyl ester carboxylesterase
MTSWAWRDPALGESREVTLPSGTVCYHDTGTGPVLVFVHGYLVNTNIWRKLVPLLGDRFRCITPDWPLGSHLVAMNRDADLSPPGVAAVIGQFLDALDLRDVTLVGNDSGGAYSQIVAANHPDRLGGLVLNTCETPDCTWPPSPRRVRPAESNRSASGDLSRALSGAPDQANLAVAQYLRLAGEVLRRRGRHGNLRPSGPDRRGHPGGRPQSDRQCVRPVQPRRCETHHGRLRQADTAGLGQRGPRLSAFRSRTRSGSPPAWVRHCTPSPTATPTHPKTNLTSRLT